MLNRANLEIIYPVSFKIAISFAENLCFFEESIFTHFKGQKKEAFDKASIFIDF